MSSSNERAEQKGFAAKPERRTRIISIRLTPTQEKLLDDLAQERDMGRAELIRSALDFWLAQGAPGSKT